MELRRRSDGTYELVRNDRDDHPAFGIYQYLPDGRYVIIDEDPGEGVVPGALPEGDLRDRPARSAGPPWAAFRSPGPARPAHGAGPVLSSALGGPGRVARPGGLRWGRRGARPRGDVDLGAGSGWPPQGYADGRYRVVVEGGRPFAAVAAPLAIEPGAAGVYLEAEVSVTGGAGRAGLHCRGGQDGQTLYALSVGADGSWAMERYEGGVGVVLDGGTLPDTVLSDPGQPNLLRLICGAGAAGTPVSLVFTVNATQYLTVVDPVALDPGATSTAGLFVDAQDGGPAEAAYDNAAVWVAEPE